MSSVSAFAEYPLLSRAPLIPIALDAPPEAAFIGIGRHGRIPVEHYRLPDRWCLHLYRWTGMITFHYQGKQHSFPVRPGFGGFLPPDTPLSHHFGQNPSAHVVALFTMPTTTVSHRMVHLPAMQDLGEDFGRYNVQLERALAAYPIHPQRTIAALWEMLWQWAERAPTAALTEDAHPAVVNARQIIELRLSEPLKVAQIADAVDLSHNHLTRLFQETMGMTVIAYLRERRVDRARQLLAHSTAPIKTIAAQVGLPDLHQFNKTVRQITGKSPRALRLENQTEGD